MKTTKCAVLGFLALSLGSQAMQAANGIWTGGGADGLWSNANNWSGGTIPGNTAGTQTNSNAGANTDAAAFNTVTANNSVTIDTGRSINDILFFGGVGSYTIGSTSGPTLYSYSSLFEVGNLGTLDGVVTGNLTGASQVTEAINAPIVMQYVGVAYTGISFYNNAASGTGTGSAIFNVGGSITAASTANLTTPSLTLRGSNTNTNTISGLIAPGNASQVFSIIKNDGGTWNLTNTSNSFNSTMYVAAGTLGVTAVANIGTVSSIGTGTASGGTNGTPNGSYIALSQNTAAATGVFQFNGTSGGTTNRPFFIENGTTGGTGTITNTVSGQTLALNGNVLTLTPASASGLILNGAGNITMGGTIGTSVASQAVALTVGGSYLTTAGNGATATSTGTFTLNSATGNFYTGTTTVTSGTLSVSNTSGSATGSGNVNLGATSGTTVATLASGAGNTGIIAGTVTAGLKATANISPGGPGTVGMLTLGNLSAANGSTFTYDLGVNAAASDQLTLGTGANAGTGTLTAPATGTNGLAFNITGGVVGTTYDLLNYGTGTNLDVNDLTTIGSTTGTFALNTNNNTGNFEIDFTVLTAVPEPSTWVASVLFCGMLLVWSCRRRAAAVR